MQKIVRLLNAFDIISKVFASMESFGKDTGISKPELLVMESISAENGIKMSDIARMLDMNMSTATGIIDRLIEKKIALRIRNGGDRRVVRVTLTEKGIKINTDYQKKKKEIFSRMMELLTEKEQEIFIQVLEKIAGEIKKGYEYK